MKALERLVKNLSSLPGIGPKSARRIAYSLINNDQNFNETLAEDIKTVKDRVFHCSICGALTETDPCDICTDPSRDRSVMCVVEQPQDVETLAASGAYTGLYHVLGGAISPLDGIGPDKLRFSELKSRIGEGSFSEIIVATNPTDEGDTTALYISRMFRDSGIRITRLASGLPIGGDLEYADRTTLARSLSHRTEI